LHRDKFKSDEEGNILRIENGPTQIHTDKMRFEEIGYEGSVDMYYDWYRAGRFVNEESDLDDRNYKKSKIKDEMAIEYEEKFEQRLESGIDQTIPFEIDIPVPDDDDIPF
jgi:hypothetical protein